MPRAELVAYVRNELKRHQSVDGNADSCEFQLSYAVCKCGNWVGPGSTFEDHRAIALVDALAIHMSATADFDPVIEYHAAQLELLRARERMVARIGGES